MTKSITNINKNTWKVILIKTIEDKEPIYYRLVNLYDYREVDIPAYRILDELVNNKKDIINIRSKNNKVHIINEDGYESTSDIIVVDEFDKEIPNLFEWSLRNDFIGSEVISRFDVKKNIEAPSNIKLHTHSKIYWTCKNNHTIRCGVAAYIGMGCKCPICEMEKQGETPSLSYWAHLTDNTDILKEYDNAENNKELSKDIGWKARRKVWFRREEEEVQEYLNNITVKGMEVPFTKNSKEKIDLSRHK